MSKPKFNARNLTFPQQKCRTHLDTNTSGWLTATANSMNIEIYLN